MINKNKIKFLIIISLLVSCSGQPENDIKENELNAAVHPRLPIIEVDWVSTVYDFPLEEFENWEIWYKNKNSSLDYTIVEFNPLSKSIDHPLFRLKNLEYSTEYEIIVKAKLVSGVTEGKIVNVKTVDDTFSPSKIYIPYATPYINSVAFQSGMSEIEDDFIDIYVDGELSKTYNQNTRVYEIRNLESGKEYIFDIYIRDKAGNVSPKASFIRTTLKSLAINREYFAEYSDHIKENYISDSNYSYKNYNSHYPYETDNKEFKVLIDAAFNKNLEPFKSFINNGGDKDLIIFVGNNFEYYRTNLIELCIEANFKEGLEYLYSIKPKSYLSNDMLFSAMIALNLDIVKFIYNYKGFDKDNVKLSDKRYRYSLREKAYKIITLEENWKIIDFIVTNIPEDIKYLMTSACETGAVKVVDYLIDNGANPEELVVLDKDYIIRATNKSIWHDQYEVLDFILSKGYSGVINEFKEPVVFKEKSRFLYSYSHPFNDIDDLYTMTILLKYLDRISAEDYFRFIEFGINNNYYDFLNVFKKCGLSLENIKENNPELLYLYINNKKGLSYLLDNNLDINAVDDSGQNALFYATSPKVIEMLLQIGVDPKCKNNKGETLEDFYKKFNRVGCIEVLQKNIKV